MNCPAQEHWALSRAATEFFMSAQAERNSLCKWSWLRVMLSLCTEDAGADSLCLSLLDGIGPW